MNGQQTRRAELLKCFHYWAGYLAKVVFAKSFAASVVASFSAALSAVVVTIALTASLTGCEPSVPPDTVAPKITLRQPTFSGETGDQVVPSAMVLSVIDDKDPNPTVTATLDGQTIPYGVAYQFLNAGNYSLRLTARDNSGNSSFADIQVSIGTGFPVVTGLDNLQTAINPIVDAVMDLLKGIQATDAKDGDITSKIKVYLKNNLGQYTEIATPRTYTAEFPGNIDLKYQISDNDGHTVEIPKTLTVAPKVQETVTVPQMTIMPTDPAFNPNSPDRVSYSTVKNRYEYLDKLNVPESWAMGEAMIRSGTNSLTPAQYLAKLNKRQVALDNGSVPTGTIDTDGQFILSNTNINKNAHEDKCNQILLAKKNNGLGSTGVVGPIIQQTGVNKAIRMGDGWSTIPYYPAVPIKNRLQNNPDKYLILSTSNSYDISKSDVKDILMTGRVLRFNAGGNNINLDGQPKTISVTEEAQTGDPRELCRSPGGYSFGNTVPIGVQRVGGARETFDVTIGERDGTVKTSLLRGDPKDIRYAPGCHAYLSPDANKIVADKSVATSRATPVQAGLTYLVAVAYPELTPVELIKKMREDYVKPVTVNYSLDQTKSFTSKTTDVGKAFESLNAKIPSQVSLSASSPIVIAKGRYKFNIIHGDGIIKSDGNTLTQTDINDISKRGTLSQETYSISPVLLKKLGHKAGDKITIHISVCSDAAEDYKQIQDLSYEVNLVN